MKLIFIIGSPRTGTTLMAKWLKESSKDTFCTRESGIQLVAHWCLSSIRFLSRMTDFKDMFVRQIKNMVHQFYREIGWDGKTTIVDKQPYAFSDNSYFYEHLNLIFEEKLFVIYLFRNPFDVINSMRNRTFGEVRGSVLNPNKKYTYWDSKDINNFMAPISYRFSHLENIVGDIKAERGAEGVWSLEKCCLHYKNAINVLDEITKFKNILIVDYDLLKDKPYRDFVKNWIQSKTGIHITSEIPFSKPDGHILLSLKDKDFINQYLGKEGLANYQKLKSYAESQFLLTTKI